MKGKAEEILAEAESWILTPFHHRACIKGVGVDCAHFLIGVFSNVGMGGPPGQQVEEYPPDWHFHRSEERFLAYIKKYCREVKSPKPGDIAMFRFGRCASHGAIVVEWPRVIHAYKGQGVVYSDADQAELQGRLHSFWRAK